MSITQQLDLGSASPVWNAAAANDKSVVLVLSNFDIDLFTLLKQDRSINYVYFSLLLCLDNRLLSVKNIAYSVKKI